MAETTEMKLEIQSWDETAYREDGDRRFTHAKVTVGAVEDGLSGAWEALMFYRPDGSATYVTLMELKGTLAGRTGAFALQGTGTYGTSAVVDYTVVEGSGTDGLAGITGTAHSESTQADYPNMPLTLTYDLA